MSYAFLFHPKAREEGKNVSTTNACASRFSTHPFPGYVLMRVCLRWGKLGRM